MSEYQLEQETLGNWFSLFHLSLFMSGRLTGLPR